MVVCYWMSWTGYDLQYLTVVLSYTFLKAESMRLSNVGEEKTPRDAS